MERTQKTPQIHPKSTPNQDVVDPGGGVQINGDVNITSTHVHHHYGPIMEDLPPIFPRVKEISIEIPAGVLLVAVLLGILIWLSYELYHGVTSWLHQVLQYYAENKTEIHSVGSIALGWILVGFIIYKKLDHGKAEDYDW